MAAASPDLSLRRRGAALVSMLGGSATVAFLSLRHGHADWLGLAFAGMLAVGGIGITAKHLVLQTLSRGMAWVLAAPMGLVLLFEAMRGELPSWEVGALFATLGSALLLARPALHSKDAQAQFHPHRFRRTLLAGSTATAASAYLTGGVSLEMLSHDGLFSAGTLGFGLLTVALLGVSTAVVRMRSWGILLGAALSTVMLVLAPIVGREAGLGLVMLAAPMLLLHLMPILLARWGAAGTPIRVGASASASDASASTTRYRVAAHDDLDAAIDADGEELPQERRHVHV